MMSGDKSREEQRAALSFLDASARQLARWHRTGEEEVMEQLVALLGLAQEHSGRGGPQRAVQHMVRDPVLLSVVFQNIDLLYEHDYPGADAISIAVMAALEQLESRTRTPEAQRLP